MALTLAQAQQAGTLASGVVALQAFIKQLQAAQTSGQPVNSIQIGIGGSTGGAPVFQATLSVADSGVQLTQLVKLSNSLMAEWLAAARGALTHDRSKHTERPSYGLRAVMPSILAPITPARQRLALCAKPVSVSPSAPSSARPWPSPASPLGGRHGP